MANKNDIEGDVGQIVAGDSVVGPTLNNVMHLNIGEKEEKYLTKMQRTEINKKVKELEAISGINWRVLYRELLNKFGAEVMDVFPRSKFNEACEHIDIRLAEYEDANVKNDQIESTSQELTLTPVPTPNAIQTAHIQVKEIPCKACQANSAQLKKTNFKLHVLFGLMVLMMITEAIFLMSATPAKASQGKLNIDRPVEQSCHYDGKIQSIGSTVRMADGIIRQCMDAPGDAPSFWDLLSKPKH